MSDGVLNTTEVAVVGAGIAGMSAALEANRAGVRTLLISNGPLGRSNSIMAQGGIQLPRDEPADIQLMLEDALRVGGDELSETRVKAFIAELPQLQSKLEAMGLEFDRDDDGELIRRRAGGLSSPRIATVGDQIGRPLMRILKDRVTTACEVIASAAVENIEVSDGRFILATPDGLVEAGAVVVATGGTAYQEALDTGALTSNPPNENASLRATINALGLREMGPRRFQWHPFGLEESRKGITVACVPESVAALGPRLIIDPGGEEVCRLPAPRSDVVDAMNGVSSSGGEVRLTLSELDNRVLTRFPKVQRLIRDFGADPLVVPVLHYELSGYPTGEDQSSMIDGLFLAGEIVGGIHGRERLMGAGVADSLVHGSRAGESAAAFVKAS